MRTRTILLVIAALLFTAGILITKARGEDTPPRLAYLGVSVKKDSTIVVNVMPGSPAQKAGIRPGDVITSLHGEAVHNDIELLNIMLSHNPGEQTSLGVLRTPTRGLALNVTFTELTQASFKKLSRYEVLEWSGPKNPSFDPLGGPVTVFYFTATWCAPCKELRPHIEKIYQQFKNNSEFRFVAVAISDDKNDRDEYLALKKLQRQGHYPFTIMRNSTIWKETGVETIPTAIIVNKTNDIIGEYHGKDLLPDKCATLLKELNLLLANPRPGDLAWL